jgi:cyanophycin synthetase
MTCTDGIYLDGRRTETRDCSGPQSARTVFMNPRVEVAVLETARGGILREGLGFDRCTVGIVTNLGRGDHFGLRGVETLEELARVKRVVIENVAADGWGILNAADPQTAAMAPACPGRVVFFARDEVEPILRAHRSGGGAAIFVREGRIVVADGPEEQAIAPIAEIPFLHGGIPFQIENALAATAAAWCLGVPPEDIAGALRAFAGNPDECPARFNVLSVRGATVIVDYAHNPSALEAVIAGLDVFPSSRRTVVTSGSNRRDADVLEMGEMMGWAFDRVLFYADWGHSGRADGALNRVLREGVAKGPRAADVRELATEREAIDAALGEVMSGELIVLGVEAIEDSLRYVRSLTQ